MFFPLLIILRVIRKSYISVIILNNLQVTKHQRPQQWIWVNSDGLGFLKKSEFTCFLLQDVLLFYYTQWCGFCSVLNHILIQLARLLQGNGTIAVARCVVLDSQCWQHLIVFTCLNPSLKSLLIVKHKFSDSPFRVNVARNDLPWEFMVDRVPSILLFPKYR